MNFFVLQEAFDRTFARGAWDISEAMSETAAMMIPRNMKYDRCIMGG